MNAQQPTNPTPNDAIWFDRIDKRFGERTVVHNLTLRIPRAQTTVVLGPSGTGKSTLLRMATGLLAPDAGRVVTLDVDVFAAKPRVLQTLRQRIGVLFQDNALFSSMSVQNNVAFPLLRVKQLDHDEAHGRAEQLLTSVGLVGMGARMPDALSGGQRKRVALARALALEPELVLFDEPTSGLDPQTSAAIDALIVATQARLKTTFVVITHDVMSARAIAHHTAMLHGGSLVAFGPTEAVFASKDPLVRDFLDRVAPL